MLDGSRYRIRTSHPRRPGVWTGVYLKNGDKVGSPGESCAGVSQEILESMLRNDYIEPINSAPEPMPEPEPQPEEDGD